jgi:DNA-binding NtrC family response regulator
MRLLIADDQPDVLESLRLLLAPQGFKLTMVTSPAAVVDQLRAAGWDAVLMDLNYQRGTTSGDEGLELLAAIRADQPDLPIVVMTAWGDIDLAVRAMRAGAQSFVEKPWDNRKLVQILEREIAAGKGRARAQRASRARTA